MLYLNCFWAFLLLVFLERTSSDAIMGFFFGGVFPFFLAKKNTCACLRAVDTLCRRLDLWYGIFYMANSSIFDLALAILFLKFLFVIVT